MASRFFPVIISRWIDVFRTPVSGSFAMTMQLLKYAPPSSSARVGTVSSYRFGTRVTSSWQGGFSTITGATGFS